MAHTIVCFPFIDWSIHDIFALNALLTDMNRTVEHPLTPADRVDRRRRRVIAFLHAEGGRGLAPRGRQWLQREVRQ